MRLALSDEQHQLIHLADRLASEVAGGDPDAGWQALVDAGLLGLRMPDDAGRPSASVFDLMLVAERLAAHGSDVPFVGQAVLAPELLRLTGAPPDVQLAVAEGTTRLAVCTGADLRFPLPRPGLMTRRSRGTAPERAGASSSGRRAWRRSSSLPRSMVPTGRGRFVRSSRGAPDRSRAVPAMPSTRTVGWRCSSPCWPRIWSERWRVRWRLPWPT